LEFEGHSLGLAATTLSRNKWETYFLMQHYAPTRYWIGRGAARGFSVVYGHARPGASQQLNAKFGAVFVQDFPDWYGTGERYKLYRIAL
jgi:hypothetical protein